MKMNIIALVHLIAGILIMAVSRPLRNRKIKVNALYGIRISEAFKSEQRWYDINAYGGRLFLSWGIMIIITGLIGIALPQHQWIMYAWASLAIILGGLSIVVFAVIRYAGRTKTP